VLFRSLALHRLASIRSTGCNAIRVAGAPSSCSSAASISGSCRRAATPLRLGRLVLLFDLGFRRSTLRHPDLVQADRLSAGDRRREIDRAGDEGQAQESLPLARGMRSSRC